MTGIVDSANNYFIEVSFHHAPPPLIIWSTSSGSFSHMCVTVRCSKTHQVHQYFDSNFAGQASDCDGSLNITTIFEPFTAWARSGNYKGEPSLTFIPPSWQADAPLSVHDGTAFLGEFGAPNTQTCRTLITAALDYMQENDDVFVGWTWWVAGTVRGHSACIEPSCSMGAEQLI